MTAWIKFVGRIPPVGGKKIGWKINGVLYKSFIADMTADTWVRHTEVGNIIPGGDKNYVIFIFSGMA